MRNNWFMLLVCACCASFLTGCTMLDPYQYKNGRKAYMIKVEEPRIESEQSNSIFLINQTIAVFPFVDNRNAYAIIYGTSIPFSLIAAKSLAANGVRYGIFKKIGMAPVEAYENQNMSFDAENFGVLKDLSRATGVIWGNINNFETDITPSKKQQYYDITFFVSGNIKMMLGNGSIYYSHEFSKKRTYTFNSKGWITYGLDDIYSSGQYISDFIGWVMKGELDLIAMNSKQIVSGSLITTDVVTDTLSYPPENTMVYSFSDINSMQLSNAFFTLGGSILGSIAGMYVANQIIGGWAAFFLGYPLGALAGVGIVALLNMGNAERMEKESVFYAFRPATNTDIIMSLSILKSRF